MSWSPGISSRALSPTTSLESDPIQKRCEQQSLCKMAEALCNRNDADLAKAVALQQVDLFRADRTAMLALGLHFGFVDWIQEVVNQGCTVADYLEFIDLPLTSGPLLKGPAEGFLTLLRGGLPVDLVLGGTGRSIMCMRLCNGPEQETILLGALQTGWQPKRAGNELGAVIWICAELGLVGVLDKLEDPAARVALAIRLKSEPHLREAIATWRAGAHKAEFWQSDFLVTCALVDGPVESLCILLRAGLPFDLPDDEGNPLLLSKILSGPGLDQLLSAALEGGWAPQKSTTRFLSLVVTGLFQQGLAARGIELLVTHGMPIDQRDEFGLWIIGSQLAPGQLDLYKTLFGLGLSANIEQSPEDRFIFKLIDEGHIDLIQLFLEHDLDIHHRSSFRGHVLSRLLEHRALHVGILRNTTRALERHWGAESFAQRYAALESSSLDPLELGLFLGLEHDALNGPIAPPELIGLYETLKALGEEPAATHAWEMCVKMRDAHVGQFRAQIREATNALSLREVACAPPDELTCPITGELIAKPVRDETGRLYERDAIEAYYRGSPRHLDDGTLCSPWGVAVASTAVHPDEAVFGKIVRWKVLQSERKIDQLRRVALHSLTTPELVERFNGFRSEQFTLVQALDRAQWVEAVASPTSVEPGQRFYHCTSYEALCSIIADGVQITCPANTEEAPFGRGLYLSSDGVTYLSEQHPSVLVLEVVEPLEGRLLYPKDELKDGLGLSTAEVDEQLAALQQSTPFLRHAGLPPAHTELVLRNPQRKLQIVGVVLHMREDRPVEEQIVPIEKFMAQDNLQLHETWASAQEEESFDDLVKLRTSNGTALSFKPLRDQKELRLLRAEVGASRLAHRLIGDLVPQAYPMTRAGCHGVQSSWRALRPLGLDPNEPLNVESLTSTQLEQLFAHMLVDWVISNHDNHIGQFGLDSETNNLLALDKSRAFQLVRGQEISSEAAAAGTRLKVAEIAGDTAPPSLFTLEADADCNVYQTLRNAIAVKRVTINWEAKVIQQVVAQISMLTSETVQGCLKEYAALTFPGKELSFYSDVLLRAKRLRDDFRQYAAEHPVPVRRAPVRSRRPVVIAP